MKKLRGIFTALVWILFTLPVAAGGTVYYIEAVASRTEADMTALLLWTCVILLLTGLAAVISGWTKKRPGILCPGKGASLALEIISCIILVGAGIYFRIGQEFVAFWSEQDGNPVVEAALVTLNRTTGGFHDPVTAAYEFLLNRVFLLVGNLSLAAAGMQLVLFITGGLLLYFLVRRCYGAFTAVILLGGLMLLPEMIRSSMYCSPEILMFLGAVILGWVLHLCLDRRLKGQSAALLDFLVLALFIAGCVCVDQSEWTGISGESVFEIVRAAGGQTAFLLGILCAVLFLFTEVRQMAAVYMLMAVFPTVVQLLGLEGNVGLMAALGIVMSTLLGILLDGLLFGKPVAEAAEAAQGTVPNADEAEAVSQKTETAGEAIQETTSALPQEKPEEILQEETEEGLEETDDVHLSKQTEETLQKTVDLSLKEKPEEVSQETADVFPKEKTEEILQEADGENRKGGEQEISEPVTETVQEAEPEIYIPETMEIPKRKKRSKIDFDREFPEEEMSFDLEVEDGEEFDR